MKPDTPRAQALAFIAAYEHDQSDDYERQIVRIAQTWLKIMNSRQPVHGFVDRLYRELKECDEASMGAAWADLQQKFTAWAVAEEWLDIGQL